MVTTTTFGPSPVRQVPKKKPKPKLPMVPIILGILTVLGLGVDGIFSMQASSERARADVLTAGMTQLAEMAGVEGVTAETLADPAAVDASINAVAETLSGTIAQGELSANELQQAQAELTRLRNDLNAANQQIATLEASTVSLQRDLAAREQDATAHADELAALREAHQVEVQRLAAANAALNQQLAEASQPAAGGEDMTEAEEGDAAAEPEMMIEEDVAMIEEAPAELDAFEADTQPVVGTSVDLGDRSRFFSSMTYDDVSGDLQFDLASGGTLTYQNVPQELVDQLLDVPVLDTLFMLRIYQEFITDPNEREIIRGLRR